MPAAPARPPAASRRRPGPRARHPARPPADRPAPRRTRGPTAVPGQDPDRRARAPVPAGRRSRSLRQRWSGHPVPGRSAVWRPQRRRKGPGPRPPPLRPATEASGGAGAGRAAARSMRPVGAVTSGDEGGGGGRGGAVSCVEGGRRASPPAPPRAHLWTTAAPVDSRLASPAPGAVHSCVRPIPMGRLRVSSSRWSGGGGPPRSLARGQRGAATPGTRAVAIRPPRQPRKGPARRGPSQGRAAQARRRRHDAWPSSP